jgi:hypothetical protein
MPAQASFWRSPGSTLHQESILRVEVSKRPTLARTLPWHLLCLCLEPCCGVQARRDPITRYDFVMLDQKFCQGGELVGPSAPFLDRFCTCFGLDSW